MGISKMQVLSIIGMMSSLDQVVEICGKSENFQPDNALTFYPNNKNIKKFNIVDEKNPFNDYLKTLKNIAKEAEFKLSFKKNKFNIRNEEIKEFIDYIKLKFKPFLKQQNEILKQIKIEKKILKKALNFESISFNPKKICECKYLKCRFGSLPLDNIKKTEKSENPYVLFFPFKNDKKQCWGIYFCPIENLEEIDDIFKGFGFEKLDVFGSNNSFSEEILEIQKKVNELEKKLSVIKKQILEFLNKNKEKILVFYTKLSELKACYDIKKNTFKYGDSFILVGWIVKEKADLMKKNLENLQDIEFCAENAEEAVGHEIPVVLKNKSFFKPFEFLIEMYGTPTYKGFDPTAFFSITYTIIFGMMFGDFGQGLVLALSGYILYKLKQKELYKIVYYCGLSSSFFGLVYGSFFGFENALNFLYKALGFHEKPVEVMHSTTTPKLLMTTIGLGSILLIISIFINIYNNFKQKNISEAILTRNGIAGFTFYFALIGGVFLNVLAKINVFSPVFIILFIILPLIFIFLRKPIEVLIFKKGTLKNISWKEYFMEGLIELLFETVLNYLSNTMSFLRIGIFVLMHSSLMMVVLEVAKIFPSILYWPIIVVGNVGIMAIEALFVAIQTLRLEFYEIFSRFFENQGKKFEPVVIK